MLPERHHLAARENAACGSDEQLDANESYDQDGAHDSSDDGEDEAATSTTSAGAENDEAERNSGLCSASKNACFWSYW